MKTTFRRLGAAARALALMAGFIAAGQSAHAACGGPTGNAGDVIYASNYNTMAYCNGTAWTSMAGGVSVTVNTSGGGATPAGSSADVQFNSSGALAADTGNFTYSSGLLKTPNISTTAITASGLGTFGTALVTGGMTVAGQASITTISTTVVSFKSPTTISNVIGGSGNSISSGTSSVSTSASGVGIFAGGRQLMDATGAGMTIYSPLIVSSTSSVTGTVIASFMGGNGRQMQINQPDPTDTNSPFTFVTPNSFLFMTDTNDGLYIDASGNVAVGTDNNGAVPNPGLQFFKSGVMKIGNSAGSSGFTFIQFIRSGVAIGSITQNGTTGILYNTTSDRRLKEDITNTREGLQKLMQLPVRDFAFRKDPSHTIITGFIAQELDKVFPEAVTTNGDNGETPLKDESKPWAVDYGRLTPLIVKAVQELNVHTDAALKAANDNISRQQGEIDELRVKLNKLEHAINK